MQTGPTCDCLELKDMNYSDLVVQKRWMLTGGLGQGLASILGLGVWNCTFCVSLFQFWPFASALFLDPKRLQTKSAKLFFYKDERRQLF